jgi:hypothetical protein
MIAGREEPNPGKVRRTNRSDFRARTCRQMPTGGAKASNVAALAARRNANFGRYSVFKRSVIGCVKKTRPYER